MSTFSLGIAAYAEEPTVGEKVENSTNKTVDSPLFQGSCRVS